jgi:uncharacterized membrane protein
MNTYRTLGLLVAGVLTAVSSPALAQDVGGAPLPDTAAMSLIFVVFPDEAGAQQALTELDRSDTSAAGQVESYAVLSKGQGGDVTVQKSSKKDQGKSTSPRADQAVDGVVALLGQRPGQAGGGARENQQISAENAEKMQEMLTPGTSAVIVVVAEPAADDVSAALSDNDAHVVEAPLAAPSVPAEGPQPAK